MEAIKKKTGNLLEGMLSFSGRKCLVELKGERPN